MASCSKKLMAWVRPGVLLVRASFLRSQIVFSALDLPAFERPANATSARSSAGNADILGAETVNCIWLKWAGVELFMGFWNNVGCTGLRRQLCGKRNGWYTMNTISGRAKH